MRIRQGFEEKSRLGRLLVNRDYLSEGQLEEGLRVQRETGQRLGEVLIAAGWISERELHRVLKHQSRYRNAAALVTVVTLPFQPMVTLASTNANAAQIDAGAGELYERGGFAPLSDQEMSEVSAQSGVGLVKHLNSVAGMADSARNDPAGELPDVDVVEGIKLAAHVFVPVLSFLDSDFSISGVHYREGEPRYSLQSDGGLRLAFPERIEEIRMDNIRVMGGQTPGMGNISVRDIRFHPDSQMTIYTR
ncbi:pilus assembly protein PilB [Marinobacter sp. VGCF2001]|uniref:pilus assembly protein PilB n=1 Tax=Marinobacter sp. VGCF2001 TaxID=3417189 RepID=UPI003CE799DB